VRRNYTHGGQPNNNIMTRNNNISGSAPLFCTYFNKSGHILSSCFFKQRKARASNDLNSNLLAVSGVRLVNKFPLCDASTSYQS